MRCPTLDDFPSTSLGAGARYRVTERANLVAFPVEASLPHAPDGFYLYAFVEGDRVGRWEWTADSRVLRQVMQAFRATTSPDYVPPQWEAPGGERAMIRPTIADFLAHAMEHGRPDAPEAEPPEWLTLHFPLGQQP